MLGSPILGICMVVFSTILEKCIESSVLELQFRLLATYHNVCRGEFVE